MLGGSAGTEAREMSVARARDTMAVPWQMLGHSTEGHSV